MILEDFAMLISDTTRSKAYLQAMIREMKLPGQCVVYSENIKKMQEETNEYIESNYKEKYFNADMPILYSLKKANISYVLVENKDINSERMRNTLLKLNQKYVIYSGYGGYILKSHLFKLGKKFIHIHAGILPQYRGSTTVYYSYLQEGTLGATAIFLSEGIDEGEIIVQDSFGIPKEMVDIDYVYEPYIRSRVLIKLIDQYLENGKLKSYEQGQGAETYFIIHPVLKHLAILGVDR